MVAMSSSFVLRPNKAMLGESTSAFYVIKRSIYYARESLGSPTRGVRPAKMVCIHARSMFCPVRMTASRRDQK
jgi:hypothetical protein